MPQRLAFVSGSLRGVAEALKRFIAGDKDVVHTGRAKAGVQPPPPQDPEAVAARWVEGAPIDWSQHYRGHDIPPSRVSLPMAVAS